VNIQHSSRTDEWYTPPNVVEMVHAVLGSVDLDPASSNRANLYLKAKTVLTHEDDALEVEWPVDDSQTIFCNPPGGKTKNKSNTALFWQRLHQHQFKDAIFLAFSLEALQTTQGKDVPPMMAYPFCVPSKRLRFRDANWDEGPAPSHSNCIVYVPRVVDRTHKFVEVFSHLGRCKR